jgi:hypothetical protein
MALLKEGLNDDIEFFRKMCVGYVSELLAERLSNENELRSIMVRKLGDSSKRVC